MNIYLKVSSALLSVVLIISNIGFILKSLFAAFSIFILYGIYSSLKKLWISENLNYNHQMFGSHEEVRAVARNRGKASKQFSLASSQGWIKYRDAQRKSDALVNTIFFSKSIRNEKMEALLREILGFVLRDFVENWFKNISRNPQFLAYVDYVLHYAIAELYSRIANIDTTQLILIRISGILTAHIREFQNAEKLLRASRLNPSKDPDEMNRQLALHYLQGKLHPALTATAPDTIQSEYLWLRKRLKPLIPLLTPRKEASSGIISVLLREILITCLLRPALNNFSQPDYWNQLGETWGGYFLDQQHQSHLLRKPSEYIPDILDPYSPGKANPPSFDAYLRQISSCSSLAGAYKIKDNILLEIEKKSASIEGCAADDIINGTKVSKIASYISRLQVALKRVDKVIAKISLKGTSSASLAGKFSRDLLGSSSTDILTLNQVLEDSSLLPFFDDYLNIVGRNALLQFFVAGTSFQDQLCIEKLITSIEEDLDPSIVETWDLVGVSATLCDLYKDFFAADAIMTISHFLEPTITQSLELYVEEAQTQLSSQCDSLSLSAVSQNGISTLSGVKYIMVAIFEVVSIFKREDFPAFLKHPIGQKLSSRLMSSSNPLRFLRSSRSPERTTVDQQQVSNRVSMESDRSEYNEENFDFGKRQKRLSVLLLGSTMKMIGRIGGGMKVRPSIEEKEIFVTQTSPPLQENDESVTEGELHNIINSEENSFAPSGTIASSTQHVSLDAKKKLHRLSPFFGAESKMHQKSDDFAASGKAFLENLRFKKSEGEKVSKPIPLLVDGKSRGASSNDEPATHPALDFSLDLPKSASEYESGTLSLPSAFKDDSFIQLEIEEQQKSVPFDEDIDLEQNLDSLPPMLILPARFFQLDGTMENLQKDYDDAEKQIKIAEKNGDSENLKGLNYIKRGIWHDIQDTQAEKQKIERLELENVVVSGRCSVKILESHIISQEGKEYAVYPIQVSRVNEEGASSGWMIPRRYSQFVSLHQDLKAKFPALMMNYELPGKLISGIMKGRSHFMETRRKALEKYLDKLLKHQEICKFQGFRRFLCHPQIIKLLFGAAVDNDESPSKKSFIRTVFNSVDDTVDTIFQKKKKSVRPNSFQQGPSNVFSHNTISSLQSIDSITDDATSTTEPIIDLFVELFEIKGLRRQAIVIFLQNLFGDTVERRVTETLNDALNQERLGALLASIRDTYWPNGVWGSNQAPRTYDQKIRSKFESSSKLIQLFPELFGGIVGRQSSRKGAIRLSTVFQNPRLNQHLIYLILDQILLVMFPLI